MRLKFTPFIPHHNLDITLPDTGVVVVVGKNGSGKSSLLEGYCTALWAKSLRGASPWRGSETNVCVELPGCDVVRTSARVAVNGKAELTPSKTQPGINALVGDWAQWKKTRVFDSELVMRFGSSQPAERKKLVEELCGLEKLEKKAAEARKELGLAKEKAEKIGNDARVVRSALSAGEAERITAEADPILLASQTAQVKATNSSIESLQEKMAAIVAEVKGMQRSAEALHRGVCPLCGAAVAPDKLATYDTTALKQEYATLSLALKEEKATYTRLEESVRELQLQQREWSRQSEARTRQGERQEQLARLQIGMGVAEGAKVLWQAVVAYYDSVRPRLLGAVLAQLRQLAAVWLAPLTNASLVLELKGDELQLGLGERSYIELNRGHRRRLDLVLLLALAQRHTSPVRGPIWLDEALDGLDMEGCEAVASLLEVVGERELIIVLTHSEELAARLRGRKIEL